MLPSFMVNKSKTKNGKEVSYLKGWISLLLAIALAVGTWNPTVHHFIHYLFTGNPLEGFRPFYILVMIAMWILAIKVIYQGLKWYGAMIAAAIIIAFVWGLAQKNLIDASNINTLGWIADISIALIIWLGMNASIWWKKFTGVYTTDSTDEG